MSSAGLLLRMSWAPPKIFAQINFSQAFNKSPIRLLQVSRMIQHWNNFLMVTLTPFGYVSIIVWTPLHNLIYDHKTIWMIVTLVSILYIWFILLLLDVTMFLQTLIRLIITSRHVKLTPPKNGTVPCGPDSGSTLRMSKLEFTITWTLEQPLLSQKRVQDYQKL